MNHSIINITDINAKGQGVGRLDNKVAFVDHTAPGDLAEIIIIQNKKKYMVGTVKELIEPSPDRSKPFCPYFETCGGCQLQHIKYTAQLQLKEKRIRWELHKTLDTDLIEFLPIQGMANPTGYRNKAQFKVSKQGIGFYAKNSHDLVTVEQCPLQEFNTIHLIEAYRKHFLKENISFYNETTGLGYFRGLHFRSNCFGQLMAIFVVNGPKDPDFKKMVDAYLKDVPEVVSAYYNYNTLSSNVLLGSVSEHIWGQKDFYDQIGSFTFNLGPTSFFQVNRKQTEKLYIIAKNMISELHIDTLYDLYCGVGSIGIFLSDRVHKVVGIEIVPEAVEKAVNNAKRNGISNATYALGKAEEIFSKITQNKKLKNDLVVLDPPRKGCDRALLDTLIKTGCPAILYISCNPATLARDLGVLTENGYRIEKVQGVDLFSMTSHVETVALLSHQEVEKTIYIEYEPKDNEIIPYKDATYEEIKAWIKKTYGFNVTNLYIGQAKEKFGLAKRKNYNLSKKEDQVVPKCPEEKMEAIKEAFIHFKMIDEWRKKK